MQRLIGLAPLAGVDCGEILKAVSPIVVSATPDRPRVRRAHRCSRPPERWVQTQLGPVPALPAWPLRVIGLVDGSVPVSPFSGSVSLRMLKLGMSRHG